MAKLRKGVSYRRLDARPYTRRSKYKKKSFIRTTPASKVVHYDMGAANKTFPFTAYIKAKDALQIRHNALESARLTCNKLMETTVGKGSYHFKIRIYPHHVLRENALASGAGADRLSTGMKMSFGKAVGIAARVRKNQVIFEIHTDKQFVVTAKKALKRAQYKLPGSCIIEVVENKPVVKAKPKAKTTIKTPITQEKPQAEAKEEKKEEKVEVKQEVKAEPEPAESKSSVEA
jgi:large subunit ribosomal protein L10e